jgi:hypothetical protein
MFYYKVGKYISVALGILHGLGITHGDIKL